ncbi:hypothetical protein LG71_22455 [Pluralibacter gergoviae]|nr:hypothetical protein LG71_22455 [Pluralibacter gergoviae]
MCAVAGNAGICHLCYQKWTAVFKMMKNIALQPAVKIISIYLGNSRAPAFITGYIEVHAVGDLTLCKQFIIRCLPTEIVK